MSKKARDILKEMKDNLHQDVTARDLLRLSSLLVILGEDAERLTRWLIGLTLALLLLTAALLGYTIVLYEDAHADAHRGKFTDDRATQNP